MGSFTKATKAGLRRFSIWLAVGFVTAILFGLVGEFAIRLADKRGLFDDIEGKWDRFVSPVFDFLTGAIMTHLAMLFVGLAIGMSVDAFFRKKEAALATKLQAVSPDITAAELLERLMERKSLQDDGSLESLEDIRLLARDVRDAISLKNLTVWARCKGVLDKLPHDIAKYGFGIGRNSAGELYHHSQIAVEGTPRNYSDFRFLRSEVDEIWPPND